tara:strand:- start:61 stop:1467 length:1407 start_codon:yes stop_codon:yes gene_type:complete
MPLIDLANPAGSDGLAQLAGPFGSNLGGGTFPRSYEFVKRFVSTETAEGTGNNGVTQLDDPTYLGFSLMFDATSPLFNGATTSAPLTVDGGASSNFPSTPSAVAYLNAIGEGNRVQYLIAFITGILEIQNSRPYYFQTIQGLTEAWQKSFDFSVDPYTGTTGEEGVTIGCLEAIDLKMTALFNLYKMAVYDSMHKRMVLPPNLLKFDVYIYVQEIRKFKTVRNWLQSLNNQINKDEVEKLTNQNTSQVGFRFIECEWIPGASGKVFEGVTNSGGDITTTEIKFNYSDMQNVSQYAGFDSALKADKIQANTDPEFFSKAGFKKFAKDLVMDQVNGAINAAGRAGASLISGITLGNVFGVRNNLLGAISNPQALINAATGAAIQGNEIDTFGNNKSVTNIGDNPLGAPIEAAPFDVTKAFDPATPVGTNLESVDAFDEAAAVGEGLESTNVFGPSGPPSNSTITDENIFS